MELPLQEHALWLLKEFLAHHFEEDHESRNPYFCDASKDFAAHTPELLQRSLQVELPAFLTARGLREHRYASFWKRILEEGDMLSFWPSFNFLYGYNSALSACCKPPLAKPSSHSEICISLPLKLRPHYDNITSRPTYLPWRPSPYTP
jgi:hypothetical protein